MTHSISLSAAASAEIKELALRFSKELESLSGTRIRGRKLYDAFVKPLGCESFSAVMAHNGRAAPFFNYNECFAVIKREIRKHLPVLIDGPIIEAAMDNAKSPGMVILTIDCRDSAKASVATLIDSEFYKRFRNQVFSQGRYQRIQFMELLDSVNDYLAYPLAPTGTPIKISLDYQHWRNERDPLTSWEELRDFMKMIWLNASAPNAVDIEIIRVTTNGDPQTLANVDSQGQFKWIGTRVRV